MADNQHFQYRNKLLYFKKIYGKSKLWLQAYSYARHLSNKAKLHNHDAPGYLKVP